MQATVDRDRERKGLAAHPTHKGFQDTLQLSVATPIQSKPASFADKDSWPTAKSTVQKYKTASHYRRL